MLNLPKRIRPAPVVLPLATACSGRGQQASSPPAQATETPQQEPVEQGTGDGNGVDSAQPLLAVESSPPAPSRLHRAAAAGDVAQVDTLLAAGVYVNAHGPGRGLGPTPLHHAAEKGKGIITFNDMSSKEGV